MARNDNNTKRQASLFDSIIESDAVIDGKFTFREPIKNEIQFEQSNDDTEICEVEKPIQRKAIRFISFGSGSSGNCSYIGSEDCGVLIDAGIDPKKVFDTLKVNGISPDKIKGICLTHDHGDHIRYAYNIIRKNKHIHLFCTNRVLNGLLRRHNISTRIRDYHVPIYKEIPFKLANLTITAFEVPHDGSDNAGFFIEYDTLKFALATDIGHIADRASHYLTQAQFMMLESNYDSQMLETGRYPEYLKNRIRAKNGHLDNQDAAHFLSESYHEKLKYVFLCHLSNDNNTPEKARNKIIETLAQKGITVGSGEETIDDKTKNLQLVALPRFDPSRWFILRD